MTTLKTAYHWMRKRDESAQHPTVLFIYKPFYYYPLTNI